MYDWNKDGKIDMVDHWITHQIINCEKGKSENGEHCTSYQAPSYHSAPNGQKKVEYKGPSLIIIILVDIVLFTLICLLNGLQG